MLCVVFEAGSRHSWRTRTILESRIGISISWILDFQLLETWMGILEYQMGILEYRVLDSPILESRMGILESRILESQILDYRILCCVICLIA